ncbi:arylsulfatase [Reichenbachiella carrageenanivorans]|uniref:Arylsulfatase n=1 Tax=Reichenbachiella carrageenanivorans TaxID=2979869 RepID=A0ABY6CZ91_9BACT|nr:arylsulfatase [Reichenbachiella carrageenanivorans]UXX78108.1 arylsulfatase [Reichenbachiella carrageenanivorans]
MKRYYTLINAYGVWSALFSLLMVSATACSQQQHATTKASRPNIIYILADDLGYGDLSVYGQKKFQTPHLDALAQHGMRFTQHYSGSAVCAPSRSSLLTGEHTGHTPIRGNKELGTEGQIPLPEASITIAEMLQNAGYKTGAFGKWGLGFVGTEGDPNKQGFDEFYGYNCQRMAHRYYPSYLWHNQEKVYLEGNDYTQTVTYAPDKIQEATLQFIEDHKDEPFFAYVPFVLPHAELISPNDSVLARFEGRYIEDKPFEMPHDYLSDYGPDIVPKKYCSQATPHAVYATMVTRIDQYVAQIMDKLEELNLSDNTIVIFTSDNGPAVEGGADPDFFDGTAGLRGYKRDLYEGGIRAPFIAVWPGHIPAGATSTHVSTFWDMMPTFAELVGVEVPSHTDGISFLPTLLGKSGQEVHEYLYWEFPAAGGRKAIRMGQWKGVAYNLTKGKKRNFELYNLSSDPAEAHDLSADHPEIVAKLQAAMQSASLPSELFPFEDK